MTDKPASPLASLPDSEIFSRDLESMDDETIADAERRLAAITARLRRVRGDYATADAQAAADKAAKIEAKRQAKAAKAAGGKKRRKKAAAAPAEGRGEAEPDPAVTDEGDTTCSSPTV